MSDKQDVNNGDAVLGQLVNDVHVEQVQLANLNDRSDEDREDFAPSTFYEDDVCVEIHQKSTCQLCKSLIGAAAGS